MLPTGESQKRPHRFSILVDEKFDVALNLESSRRIRDHGFKNPLINQMMDDWTGVPRSKVLVSTHVLNHIIISALMEDTRMGDVELGTQFHVAQSASLDALQIQEAQAFQCLPTEDVKALTRLSEHYWGNHPGLPQEAIYIYQSYSRLRDFHFAWRSNKTKFSVKNVCECQIINRRYAFLALPNHYMVKSTHGQYWLVNESQFLLIMNKLADVCASLQYAYLATGVHHSSIFFPCVRSIILILNQIILKSDEKGYGFLKAWDAICIGVVLKRFEYRINGWRNDQFLNNVWRELRYDGIVTEDTIEIHSIWPCLDRLEPEDIFELSGLAKLAGHPEIKMDDGINKLDERVHKFIHIPDRKVHELIRHLKHMFFTRFHRRFKKMAAYSTITNPATWSRRDQKKFQEFLAGKIPLDDDTNADFWDEIQLDKNAEFDYYESIYPMLKDKAISPLRDRVVQRYLLGDSSIRYELSETRAILALLMTPNLTGHYRQYMDQFQEGDDLELCLDYLVIKLTAKEKEEKVEGRMFGQSTLLDRLRKGVVEKNTAHYLDLFLPEQSMTMSDLNKYQVLQHFRQIKLKHPDQLILQISLDIKAWNNYFRSTTVDAVGRAILDNYYGVHLFHKTMLAFEHSLIYSFNNQREFRHWFGQEGGIEGLHQYTWELVFIGAIDRVLNNLGFHYQILSCGDDCRLVVMVPAAQRMDRSEDEFRDYFLALLKEELTEFGFELKTTETLVSEALIAFGKVYQFGHSWMPSVLKRICKIHGMSNAFFPFIDDQIGQIFAIAHATCKSSTQHTIFWYMAAWWTCMHLQKVYGEAPLSTEVLTGLLLWTSALGGFPVLPLQHFFVQGESDMLTYGISNIHGLLISTRPELKRIGERLIQVPVSSEPPKKLLITAPYSIPVDLPKPGKAILLADVERILKTSSHVVNETIQEVCRLTTQPAEEAFLSALLQIDPVSPKLLQAIYSSSTFALIRDLMQKLESSQSVGQLLMVMKISKYHRVRYFNKWSRQDRIRLEALVDHLSQSGPIATSLFQTAINNTMGRLQHWCSSEIAQQLRDLSWNPITGGRSIQDITYPPVSEQISIRMPGGQHRQPLVALPGDTNYPEECLIKVKPCQSGIPGATRGQYATSIPPAEKIFLGMRTSTNVLPLRDEMQGPEQIKMKINSLTTILSMLSGRMSNSLETFLLQVLESYGKIDKERYKRRVTSQQKHGQIAHRLQAPSFEQAVRPNELANRYQICIVDSKSPGQLSSTQCNATVNFLAIMCHSICLRLYDLEYSPGSFCQSTIQRMLSFWRCRGCSRPIYEGVYSLLQDDMPLITFVGAQLMQLHHQYQDHLNEMLEKYEREHLLQFRPIDPVDVETLTNSEQEIAIQRSAEMILDNVFASDQLDHALATSSLLQQDHSIQASVFGSQPSITGEFLREYRYLPPGAIFTYLVHKNSHWFHAHNVSGHDETPEFLVTRRTTSLFYGSHIIDGLIDSPVMNRFTVDAMEFLKMCSQDLNFPVITPQSVDMKNLLKQLCTKIPAQLLKISHDWQYQRVLFHAPSFSNERFLQMIQHRTNVLTGLLFYQHSDHAYMHPSNQEFICGKYQMKLQHALDLGSDESEESQIDADARIDRYQTVLTMLAEIEPIAGTDLTEDLKELEFFQNPKMLTRPTGASFILRSLIGHGFWWLLRPRIITDADIPSLPDSEVALFQYPDTLPSVEELIAMVIDNPEVPTVLQLAGSVDELGYRAWLTIIICQFHQLKDINYNLAAIKRCYKRCTTYMQHTWPSIMLSIRTVAIDNAMKLVTKHFGTSQAVPGPSGTTQVGNLFNITDDSIFTSCSHLSYEETWTHSEIMEMKTHLSSRDWPIGDSHFKLYKFYRAYGGLTGSVNPWCMFLAEIHQHINISGVSVVLGDPTRVIAAAVLHHFPHMVIQSPLYRGTASTTFTQMPLPETTIADSTTILPALEVDVFQLDSIMECIFEGVQAASDDTFQAQLVWIVSDIELHHEGSHVPAGWENAPYLAEVVVLLQAIQIRYQQCSESVSLSLKIGTENQYDVLCCALFLSQYFEKVHLFLHPSLNSRWVILSGIGFSTHPVANYLALDPKEVVALLPLRTNSMTPVTGWITRVANLLLNHHSIQCGYSIPESSWTLYQCYHHLTTNVPSNMMIYDRTHVLKRYQLETLYASIAREDFESYIESFRPRPDQVRRSLTNKLSRYNFVTVGKWIIAGSYRDLDAELRPSLNRPLHIIMVKCKLWEPQRTLLLEECLSQDHGLSGSDCAKWSLGNRFYDPVSRNVVCFPPFSTLVRETIWLWITRNIHRQSCGWAHDLSDQ